MFELRGPNGNPSGDAAQFIQALSSARHGLSGMETNANILDLTFDDGQVGAAYDLDDVPRALYNCLTYYFDIPHSGWLHADANIYATEVSFDVELAYEDLDGPLVVRFGDRTVLTSDIRPSPIPQQPESWDTAVLEGLAQREIEAAVTLAYMARLTDLLEEHDSDLADALLLTLAQLATDPEPPKGLVREAALWLAKKVDLFLDEAAKASGKVVGGAAVGIAAYHLSRYLPDLKDHLERLIDITQ